jgi:hypothetical protein
MSEFKISVSRKAMISEIYEGDYLILMNIDQVPPHLGLAFNGKYYALSTKGRDMDVSMHTFLRMLSQRKVKSLFFKLENEDLKFDRKQLMRNILCRYTKVKGETTCLAPVKDYFSAGYNMDVTHVNLIFDLLPRLFVQGVIKDVVHIDLDELLINQTYALQRYTIDDIHARIIELNQKEAVEY